MAYVHERKSASTARTYKRGAERFEAFCQENGIASLKAQPVGFLDRYVSWLLQEGLSPSSCRLMMAGTTSYLEWRKRQGEVFPHFLPPDLPKLKKKDPYSLDTDELMRFWRACALLEDPVRTILILLPLCGLRTEEIATIPLEGGVVVNGEWIVFNVLGKGGKRRNVPLLPQGKTILGQYIHGWRVYNKPDNPYLFPGHAKGSHYHTRSIRRHMSRIRREIDLASEITPHVLRKTYLTFLERAELSPFAIAKLAGHSNIRTTHESYIHHTVKSLIGQLEGANLPTPPSTP